LHAKTGDKKKLRKGRKEKYKEGNTDKNQRNRKRGTNK
jgi:hypothetical protein